MVNVTPSNKSQECQKGKVDNNRSDDYPPNETGIVIRSGQAIDDQCRSFY